MKRTQSLVRPVTDAGLPLDARCECELAGGIALWDVSRLLPRHPHRKRKDERPKSARIERVYVHHSGALGKPGYRGAENAVLYVVGERGFPGAPYHFWLPHRGERDKSGRLVVLRLAEDEYRAWHSGAKANDHGLGVALQGDLAKSGPSSSQVELLEALLPWLLDRHGLRKTLPLSLSMHSEAGLFGGRSKPTCPGKPTEEWVRDYRGRALPGHEVVP